MANILVLGAGELGFSILTHLTSLSPPSTKITVLLRPSTFTSPSLSKASELASLKSLNVSFLSGDISSSTTAQLSALFKPFDTIISCLGFSSGSGSQIKIAKAVLEAKAKRYFPWQFGVDYDVIGRGSAQTLFDEQLDVRDLLRGQKETEWVIVSTGMFTSFLFEEYFGVVEGLNSNQQEVTVRALGSWENSVTVTSPSDIGRLTSLILLEEPRITNEIVFTAGETITYARLAALVEEVSGKKVRREVWSVDKLKQDLKADPGNVVNKYRVVFAEGRGVSWEVEKTFNARKGIEAQDVKGWLVNRLDKET